MNPFLLLVLGIVGVVISMVIGMLWYSVKTPMGRIQMKSVHPNISVEEHMKQMADMKPAMGKYMLAQALLALLTSLFIAGIMIAQRGLGSGPIYGEVGAVWLCFTVPIVGQSLLWGAVDKDLKWKKFFSDIFSNLITYFVIILVFSIIIR